MLQLHKSEQGMEDYAEFLHLEKKRFTDFCMLFFVQILLYMELLSFVFSDRMITLICS